MVGEELFLVYEVLFLFEGNVEMLGAKMYLVPFF